MACAEVSDLSILLRLTRTKTVFPLKSVSPLHPTTTSGAMSSISRQLEGVQLSKTLTLDSTSFMSGNLLDDIAPRFSLHTSINGYGPVTRINSIQQNQQLDSTEPSSSSQPNESTSNEVGLVEWRSSAIGRTKTIVKMIGNNRAITLGTLMKSNSLGSKRLFGGLGGPDIKWTETDGTWQVSEYPLDVKRPLPISLHPLSSLKNAVHI